MYSLKHLDNVVHIKKKKLVGKETLGNGVSFLNYQVTMNAKGSYIKTYNDEDLTHEVFIGVVKTNKNINITPWAVIDKFNFKLSTLTDIVKDFKEKNNNDFIFAINGDFFDLFGNLPFKNSPIGPFKVNGQVYKSNSYGEQETEIDRIQRSDNKDNFPPSSLGFSNNFKNRISISDYDKNYVVSKAVAGIFALEVFDENNKLLYQEAPLSYNENKYESETHIYFPIYENGELKQPSEKNVFVVDVKHSLTSSDDSYYGFGKVINFTESKVTAPLLISTNNKELYNVLINNPNVRIQREVYFKSDVELFTEDNIIGYSDNLLINKEYVASNRWNKRNPRTFIGVRKNGDILFFVVDGRNDNDNRYGMSYIECAALLRYFKCIDGYSLDGGGSSEMIINNNGALEIVNKVSDGKERTIANGIIISRK